MCGCLVWASHTEPIDVPVGKKLQQCRCFIRRYTCGRNLLDNRMKRFQGHICRVASILGSKALRRADRIKMKRHVDHDEHDDHDPDDHYVDHDRSYRISRPVHGAYLLRLDILDRGKDVEAMNQGAQRTFIATRYNLLQRTSVRPFMCMYFKDIHTAYDR